MSTTTQETLLDRFHRFLSKSTRQKFASLAFRLRNAITKKEVIVLPSGIRWFAQRSHLDQALREQTFETAEVKFVGRYLRPGMIVLDIGAHHGLYSLLAAALVGAKGRIVAFEPSHRERKVMKDHIRINKCRNIRVEPFAIGSKAEEATFYQVDGLENFCNSLRPPAISSLTKTVKVEVILLDDYLRKRKIKVVDFIKIDTEGAELEVLKGAIRTLNVHPRPVLMIEVADIRTAPWGYPARMILDYLSGLGYEWYEVNAEGHLTPAIEPDIRDTNLVAVPVERAAQVSKV